jgi:hypothetical protein
MEGTFNGWVPVSGIIDLEWDVDFVWGGCAGEEPWVLDYGAGEGCLKWCWAWTELEGGEVMDEVGHGARAEERNVLVQEDVERLGRCGG